MRFAVAGPSDPAKATSGVKRRIGDHSQVTSLRPEVVSRVGSRPSRCATLHFGFPNLPLSIWRALLLSSRCARDVFPRDALMLAGDFSLSGKELDVVNWFRRRRREAAGLAHADADALVRKYGGNAYRMAHHFEHEALLARLADMAPIQDRTPAQWRRVAYLIALNTHHRQSLDTVTRMANRGR
jgi:hypothetical protein